MDGQRGTNILPHHLAHIMDKPFDAAVPGDVYEVRFHITRDMFWFDIADAQIKSAPDPLSDDLIFVPLD